MTRLYSVHVHLPKLANVIREALEDLYDVDTVLAKDSGHIYIDAKDDLNEATTLRLRAFCDGFIRATETIAKWA